MIKKQILAISIILTLFVHTSFSFSEDVINPLTVAESSDYTSTSKYNDVMSFIRKLQKYSSLIKVETLCISTEGRKIPLLILGNPVPSSPAELNYDNRAVIYFQANIHAGEVEGKEAALMLARDIALSENTPYLDKLVVLIAPIFNADGNEKISPNNRRSQAGPKNGVGIRYNGQNLDLNRDGMKLESPEVQGLVQNVMLRWDPALLLDSHTHNGSYHEEVATYVWSLNPNGDNSLINYMSDSFMPGVNKILKDKYKILSIPHGDFMDVGDPEKGWRPLGPQPRYISNYIGLRNRLGLLNENYPYADFKTRVHQCHKLFHSILEYCWENKDDILQLIRDADKRTVKRGLNLTAENIFAISYDVKPIKEKITVHGWEMEVVKSDRGWRRAKKTDKKKTYTMPFYADFFPKKSIPLPYGYLIALPIPKVQEKLLQHGITVEKLLKPAKLSVEKFLVQEIKSGERAYQGHHLNTIKGEYVREEKDFPAGTLYITTAQPLANVATYLLEPESDDGLLVWNFFDRYIIPQWSRRVQEYPVYRLLKPANLVKEIIQ